MHNYDKTFEHLRDEGVKVDVRRSNPSSVCSIPWLQ